MKHRYFLCPSTGAIVLIKDIRGSWIYIKAKGSDGFSPYDYTNNKLKTFHLKENMVKNYWIEIPAAEFVLL